MPLQRRIPKRGFSNYHFRQDMQIINLEVIDRLKLNRVDAAKLKEMGAIKHADAPLKILGNGDLSVPVEITATAFSSSAREKIEKAGGKVIQS